MNHMVLFLTTPPLLGCAKSTQKGKEEDNSKGAKALITEVASFTGMQVLGVAISEKGRLFANFPRWRKGVPVAVVEVNQQDGSYAPYPNQEMNCWEIGQPVSEDVLVAVQSVVTFEDRPYVPDTGNPSSRAHWMLLASSFLMDRRIP